MLKFPQNFAHIRTYGIIYAICENAKKKNQKNHNLLSRDTVTKS